MAPTRGSQDSLDTSREPQGEDQNEGCEHCLLHGSKIAQTSITGTTWTSVTNRVVFDALMRTEAAFRAFVSDMDNISTNHFPVLLRRTSTV